MGLPVVHGEIDVKYAAGGVAHPFKDILVGQVLLRAVAGKEMPEGVQLVLSGLSKVALGTEPLEISSEFLGRDSLAIRHQEHKF